MLENKLFNLIIENIDFYIPNKRKLKISNLYCLKQIYKVLKQVLGSATPLTLYYHL